MSLYSHNFHLLPRPPRGAFSFGNEATRATLPDYNSVAELSQFVHRLVYLDLASYVPSVFLQFKIGAAIICALIVIVLAIFARRMYERSFWLFRLLKRPSGTVIVPNSFLAFSLIEGAFGVILVAFLFKLCEWFDGTAERPVNFPLWLLLTWCPLIWGAIWAAWGSFFATPGREVGTRKFTLRHMHLHATFVNILGLAIPFMIFLTVLIPSVVATIKYNHAIGLEHAWQEQYGKQESFTQAMVNDAQQVWYTLLRSHYIIAAVFAVWVVFASGMTIGYTTITWRLSRSVSRELLRTRSIQRRNEAAAMASQSQQICGNDSQLGNASIMSLQQSSRAQDKDTKETLDIERNAAENPTSPLEHNTLRVQETGTSTPRRMQASWRPRMHLPNLIHDPSRPLEGQHAKPSSHRDDRITDLRKAYIHILIHLFAIGPACAVFATIAALQMAFCHSGLEQPRGQYGNGYEKWFTIALIMVTWTASFFGSITLLAIAQRAYEPVFAAAMTTTDAHTTTGSTASLEQAPTSIRRSGSTKILNAFGVLRRDTRKSTQSPVDNALNPLQSTFFETTSRATGTAPEARAPVPYIYRNQVTSGSRGILPSSRDDLVIHETVQRTTTSHAPRQTHRARMPSDTIILQALKPSSVSDHSPAWRSPTTSFSSPQPIETVLSETASDSEEERDYFAGGHGIRAKGQRQSHRKMQHS